VSTTEHPTPLDTSLADATPGARIRESGLTADTARADDVVPAGDGRLVRLEAGEHLRIVDLRGNQAADTLFYAADDVGSRYSAAATIRSEGNVYLRAGSTLVDQDGVALVTITGDTCGRHDTLGGACSQESNVVRYGEHTRHMHACRNTFLRVALEHGEVLEKRDLAANVNFFMNVPLTPDGGLRFDDGISAPDRYVEVRAERATYVLLSNCPQLNNPCNGYDPTPVRLLTWDRETAAAGDPDAPAARPGTEPAGTTAARGDAGGAA
jgi:urea carboxylase-associated protein 1